MLIFLFWILLGVIIYTYFGYTFVLLFLSIFKKRIKIIIPEDSELPEVTLVIAAYNEKAIISDKIENSNKLNYPSDKLHHLWVTDGSTDGSEQKLSEYKNIHVLHQPDRQGKMAAVNRAMKTIKTPITVFCDANTMLDPNSIKWLVASLSIKNVGCVAGEKGILSFNKDSAAGAGEGIYWKYESLIKKLESIVGSTVGAAGELFAIRSELFEAPNANTVVDDFAVSLKIALKGYKISYQPKAKATEFASINISEEKKRKIRIAAGSFQVLFGIPALLNIFKYGFLSFQYISHKVLRWLIVPFALPFIFFSNALILINLSAYNLFHLLFLLQLVFYFWVLIGVILQKTRTKLKFVFIPYYIVMMNYTIILGFFRFISGNQDAAWEKAKRNG